jgi:hypothetical protein
MEESMKRLHRLFALTGLLSLLLALPAVGQITTSLNFETTFPFYAGNVKLPAGAYRVTPATESTGLLLIESTNGSHSAFIEYDTTNAEKAHAQTDVTFNKYGKTDFLDLLWIQGQNFGMQVAPTKFEQAAAKSGAPVRHSVSAKSGG